MSGKCIGTDLGDAPVGGYIVQSRCVGSPGQLWVRKDAIGGYVFQNVANHLCLDVPRGSLANGAQLIAWVCNGGTNQAWRYMPPTMP